MKKVIITLGPTQEPIDSLRYITNSSSGRMGKALAVEAIRRNFEVTLISGPVVLELPKDAKKIFRVRTAEEMIKKTINELEKEEYAIFISSAAIADFSPAKVRKGKIKSNERGIQLKLKPNPKLTKLAKEKFPKLFVVGFKAEYDLRKEELIKKAMEKLISENLDLVVANDLKVSIGGKSCEVYLVSKSEVEYVPLNAKEIIAKNIWKKITEMMEKNEN